MFQVFSFKIENLEELGKARNRKLLDRGIQDLLCVRGTTLVLFRKKFSETSDNRKKM